MLTEPRDGSMTCPPRDAARTVTPISCSGVTLASPFAAEEHA
jgi:hypothetical protein